jgi:methionyl-tRNA synthetase
MGSGRLSFYVLRELDIGPDGNWTDAGFARVIPPNSPTASAISSTARSPCSSVTAMESFRRTSTNCAPIRRESRGRNPRLLKQNQLQAALQSIWSLVTRANQYVDQTAPFKLAKDPAQSKRLDEVLYNLAETCRVLAVTRSLLWPFLPANGWRKIYVGHSLV